MLLLTEGQMSDHTCARLMLPGLPCARELLADRGYDSDHFRTELGKRGITPAYHPPGTPRERAATTSPAKK